MMQACRSGAAALLNVGGSIDGTEEAAVEFIERFSGLDFDRRELQRDVSDPHLPMRLKGDLVLISEKLRDDGVHAFIDGMRTLADRCEVPASAAMVVDDCEELFATYRRNRRP